MPEDPIRKLRRPIGAGRRIPVNMAGELRFLGRRRPCTIIDISSAGAHIAVDGLPDGVSEVRLVLDAGPPVAAALAWRQAGRVGLKFHAEQEWLAELWRRRDDAAAWLGR